MSWHNDINDDEIRIITSGNSGQGRDCTPRSHMRAFRHNAVRMAKWLWIIVALVIIGIIAMVWPTDKDDSSDKPQGPSIAQQTLTTPTTAATGNDGKSAAYTERRDTVIDGIRLMVLTPVNATPTLEIGPAVLNDNTVALVAQAADIRADNNEIVGLFVLKGELISKGEAKAGYCAIINGEISIGVSDASPMFEQALTTDGYFFRQFPLVVGGQVVENKNRGKASRKALAEINGRVSIVSTYDRVSMDDFSEAIVNAGFRNAVYLVGGYSYGRYKDRDGLRIIFGSSWMKEMEYVNFIVWR